MHHLPGDRSVHHGDVDQLPAPGLLAGPEGSEDTDRGHEGAAPDVGDLHSRDGWRPARRPGETDDAREAEVVDVVAHPIAIRPILAVARDRAVDEAGIHLTQPGIVDAEASGGAGPRALEDDVRLASEAGEDLAALGCLQVEGEAPLVPPEQRDAHAHRVGRCVDREHIHPEVGQQHRAERPRQLPRQIQHAEARERGGHDPVRVLNRACRDNQRRCAGRGVPSPRRGLKPGAAPGVVLPKRALAGLPPRRRHPPARDERTVAGRNRPTVEVPLDGQRVVSQQVTAGLFRGRVVCRRAPRQS